VTKFDQIRNHIRPNSLLFPPTYSTGNFPRPPYIPERFRVIPYIPFVPYPSPPYVTTVYFFSYSSSSPLSMSASMGSSPLAFFMRYTSMSSTVTSTDCIEL